MKPANATIAEHQRRVRELQHQPRLRDRSASRCRSARLAGRRRRAGSCDAATRETPSACRSRCPATGTSPPASSASAASISGTVSMINLRSAMNSPTLPEPISANRVRCREVSLLCNAHHVAKDAADTNRACDIIDAARTRAARSSSARENPAAVRDGLALSVASRTCASAAPIVRATISNRGSRSIASHAAVSKSRPVSRRLHPRDFSSMATNRGAHRAAKTSAQSHTHRRDDRAVSSRE